MRYWVFLLGFGALVVFLAMQFPSALSSTEAKMDLAYRSLLVAVIAVGALATRQEKLSVTLKYAGIWAAIIGVCVLGYSYKDALLGSRLAGTLMPSRPQMTADGGIQLRMSEGGHFFADAMVNGVSVRFLVDTGASEIVLSPRDAERAGYAVGKLDYDRSFQTANGIGGGARITLDALKVGDYTLNNVRAVVNKAPMHESLLGMTFLSQFRSYRVDGNVLTLIP